MKRKVATLLVFLLVATMVFSPQSFQTAEAVEAVSAATTEPEPTPAPNPTPAPATDPTTAPAVPATAASASGTLAASQVYVVVKGDMMYKIAPKFDLTLDQLIALNPQIKNPNLIYVGQKIIVKAADPVPASAPAPESVKIYQGLGYTTAFRNGPGADSSDVPVYSINVAMAQATFDAEGRILNVFIDGYEVATPNYDGASMPHFSGWPDKEGYNITDHATGLVTGVSVDTKESAAAEVSGWKTKRERGDSYDMNPANEWYKQMDYFQKFFVGKTVAELRAWFAKNTTAAGRPIKITTTKPEELEKLEKLTDEEKAELAEVVSGATMSISDAHGDFLGALEKAYENRVEVVVPVK